MKTNRTLSKPLIQHSPPWWLMIMMTFSALIAHWPTLFTQLVVVHSIYTKDQKQETLLYVPCLPWSPTHPAPLRPGSLGGLHYIEMACSPDKGGVVVVINSDGFPFVPESMLLENDTFLGNVTTAIRGRTFLLAEIATQLKKILLLCWINVASNSGEISIEMDVSKCIFGKRQLDDVTKNSPRLLLPTWYRQVDLRPERANGISYKLIFSQNSLKP